ncbi:hypothetical protein GCM10027160_32070 [Streptomyces calidiresistens]
MEGGSRPSGSPGSGRERRDPPAPVPTDRPGSGAAGPAAAPVRRRPVTRGPAGDRCAYTAPGRVGVERETPSGHPPCGDGCADALSQSRPVLPESDPDATKPRFFPVVSRIKTRQVTPVSVMYATTAPLGLRRGIRKA